MRRGIRRQLWGVCLVLGAASLSGGDALSGMNVVRLGRRDGPAFQGPSAHLDHSRVDLDPSFLIPKGEGGLTSHAPALTFTSDGKRMVAASASRELVAFDAKSRDLLARHRLSGNAVSAASIASSGRVAAWVVDGGGIVVLDAESGEVTARDEKARAKCLALDPSGRRLAVSRGNVLEIRLTDGLVRLHSHSAHGGEITNMAWSRDGASVASTAMDGTLVVTSARSGDTRTVARKRDALYAVDFHPSGRAIAFGGLDRKVYQRSLSGGTEKVVSGEQPYWITCLGYSPDGGSIAVGDESCDVWLYASDKPRQPVFHSKHHNECWLTQVAWSRDGRSFVFGCRPNTHAATPSLFAPLNQVEAARSQPVRQSRQALLAAIDKEMKNPQKPATRDALARFASALKTEETLSGGMAWAGASAGAFVQQLTTPLQIATADPAVASPSQPEAQATQLSYSLPVDPGLLPGPVQRLIEPHYSNQLAEQEKLKGCFCINQWRLR